MAARFLLKINDNKQSQKESHNDVIPLMSPHNLVQNSALNQVPWFLSTMLEGRNHSHITDEDTEI